MRNWNIGRGWFVVVGFSAAVASCAPASEHQLDAEVAPSVAEYTPPVVTPAPRDLTLADFESLMDQLSNWGRWGLNDELGAANLITPAKRLEAIGLVTEGITVSLEHPLLTEEAPDVPFPFQRSVLPGRVPDPTVEPNYYDGVSDQYSFRYHGWSHSHIDALCHQYHKGQMYNGFSQNTVTEAGCSVASILNLQGGIVTRGILFDIPRLKGVPYLEPGTAIYTEDLDAWEEMAGVTVRPGDAVFIRTGRWFRRAELGPWEISKSAAGLHASTTPWLKARDISFLGSDAATDVVPSQLDGVRLPVHLLSIIAMGVAMFDNQDLEALAQTAASQNRWEFMLVAAPLAVENGSGSPINALALF